MQGEPWCLLHVTGPQGKLSGWDLRQCCEFGSFRRQDEAVRNRVPVWSIGRVKVCGQHATVARGL